MDKEIPQECPLCKQPLLNVFKEPGWGFCDNCSAFIEIKKEKENV